MPTPEGGNPVVGIFRDTSIGAEPNDSQIAPPARPDPSGTGEAGDQLASSGHPTHASLPLVALVLGVSGVVLGVTVIWFFAAIPVGIVTVIVGVLARGRVAAYHDPRAASRATIGTALGCVAILLGVTGAYFLPRVIHRADRFLGTMQRSVNNDVGRVNAGLSRDVNRLDRTLSRDLRRFEAQNRADLNDLEKRTGAAMAALELRLNGDVATVSAAERRDLTQLESRLQHDLETLEASMHKQDDTLHDTVGGLDARITKIEKKLGL
jgi:hypothetical protein